MMIGINIYSQTSKAIIKTWFETGDRPTQEQFWEFIDNSYNQGTDGILEYTGNSLNIGFSPYTSKSTIGILYTGTDIPTDTTTFLNYNGTFRAAKIKIGNIEIDPEGIGTTYSSGSGIYVDNVNDQIDWLGTLDTDADIQMLTNRIYFYTPSGGKFEFDDDNMTLYQPSSKYIDIGSTFGDVILDGSGIQLLSNSTGDINIKTSSNASSEIIITDQKTTKKGIVYAADYSSDIINNDLSLINVGMTLDLINDTAIDVRSDLSDSCAILRSLIGGSGIWTQVGGKIYPISYNDSVGIGGVPIDKFYVNGNITTTGNLNIDDNIYAKYSETDSIKTYRLRLIDDPPYQAEILFDNNSFIYENVDELYFGSPASGTYTLAELAADLGAEVSNGISFYEGAIELGGILTKNTTISGNYRMNFYNSGGIRIYPYAGTGDKDVIIGTEGDFELGFYNDSIVISDGGVYSDGPIIRDTRTVPKGLSYYDQYVLYNRSNSIPDVWNVKKIVGDTANVLRSEYNINLETDTITLFPGTYITGDKRSSYGIKFRSDFGSDSAVINLKLNNSFVGFQEPRNNNYIQFDALGITFTKGGSYTFDGTYFRSTGDSLATRAYARSYGGGGGGGDVSTFGTPTKHHIPRWYDGSTITGDDSLKFTEYGIQLIVTDGNCFFNYDNSITSGFFNSNFGYLAGIGITEGQGNNNFGVNAGQEITIGDNNSNFGAYAGTHISTESGNCNFGAYAGHSYNNQYNNNFGANAGYFTQGDFNNNFGRRAGHNLIGDRNICIGDSAGHDLTGSNQLFLGSSGDKFNITIWGDLLNDSLRLNTAVRIKDSLYLDYLSCVTQPGIPWIDSISGVLTVDSVVDAGFGLTMEIPETIEEFMKDRYGNELAYYYEDNNGEIRKVYTLKRTGPGKTIQKLASRDEIIMRYVEQLEKQNKELIERVEAIEEKLKPGYKTKERKTYWYDNKEDKIKRIGRDE